MRKIKPLFFVMAVIIGIVTNAMGATASRVVPNEVSKSTANTKETVSRTTTSRATGRTTGNTQNRTTNNRTATTGSRATTSRGTVSRGGSVQNKSTVTRSSGDINSNPTVRRAGVTLRPSFADYGGRATIAGTGEQTGSNIRNDIQKITNRAATKKVSKEEIAEVKEQMAQTAELNRSCQEQYNECMDQFCSVVDSNQKRCSCSGNLSRYTKVEKAVTEANNKLNEVAQAIRYVGLSADEIRAIMTETEAEAALDDTRDTSTTRNMLKQIENMIKDPSSKTSSYASDTTWGLDMDLTFSSEPLDIFNLDFLSTGVNSSSISNLRGTELYNTAKKRCETILKQCKEVGATQTQIVGNYDLAIDKDCISYEAGLKKMNETLLSNVKSANLMLQKARLAVLQNKNQYDALGCVSALENCMTDDMVCGDDYYRCVDPTKNYIDENGKVVLGQDITVIQSFMTEYNNAAIDSDFLRSSYSNTQIGKNTCDGDGKCVVKYLLQKIGTKAKVTDEGMCRAVLDKCQYYTYDKDNKYNAYNDIVVNYVQRAMVNIRAAQQKIISEYASSCITEVANCYNQQVTQVSGWASNAGAVNIYGVMRGACRSVALTCGLAIFTGEPTIETNQDLSVDGKTYHVSGCEAAGNQTYGSAGYNDAIINCVSNMFYQSLLCPDNSTYMQSGTDTPSANGTSGGWVNTKCVCNAGYDVWGGSCLVACNSDQTRNSYGTCTGGSSSGGSGSGGDSGGSGGGTTTAYTVSYSCNGGSGTPPTSHTNVSSGTLITLKSNTCTYTGYTFNGWSCGNVGVSYTVNANVTCNAQWTSNGGGDNPPTGTYTVTYNCGEGSSGGHTGSYPAPSVVNAQTVTGICSIPEGKKFKNWQCDGNNGTVEAGGEIHVSGQVTCTAQWENDNGGGTSVQNAEPDSTCFGMDVPGTWRGCIKFDNVSYRCNTGFVVGKNIISCVDPCENVPNNTTASEDCSTTSTGDGGCVAQYCKCDPGFEPSSGQCIPINPGVTCELPATTAYADNTCTTISAEYTDGSGGGCAKANCHCNTGYYASSEDGGICKAKPANSTYNPTECSAGADGNETWEGCVIKNYKCDTNMVVRDGACVNPCAKEGGGVYDHANPARRCAAASNMCITTHCMCEVMYSVVDTGNNNKKCFPNPEIEPEEVDDLYVQGGFEYQTDNYSLTETVDGVCLLEQEGTPVALSECNETIVQKLEQASNY